MLSLSRALLRCPRRIESTGNVRSRPPRENLHLSDRFARADPPHDHRSLLGILQRHLELGAQDQVHRVARVPLPEEYAPGRQHLRPDFDFQRREGTRVGHAERCSQPRQRPGRFRW